MKIDYIDAETGKAINEGRALILVEDKEKTNVYIGNNINKDNLSYVISQLQNKLKVS